ncbi:hypothetical protein PUNSTDRAFT_107551 [Punctularia strigosozonata HHB-11173 SS5]|uniref:Nudix hydrolase domain-containing protein n=1 Tax=Punctularia strigosozonata (strain HHB-11173) TaxID=741275 RepID=R7S4W6_PUNST|nr:uncharacterized protein PUNSTDRAFT_107551 [Punctularia strigosozonata HHB-11173 SS5]EIN05273.1 hypothetical protein PUNSTDRAFT_107551 [Punctularia strigosozonata HHB-11173 SS5]
MSGSKARTSRKDREEDVETMLAQARAALRTGPPRQFSTHSTASVPDSAWFVSDLMLGAGMVILQPDTKKIAVVYDDRMDFWFLPKGRKDVGESLEQTALREAYEESGYQPQFLPLYMPHRFPSPPNPDKGVAGTRSPFAKVTEPIYVTTQTWGPRYHNDGSLRDAGGEYISFYYVGYIGADAVHHQNTGMDNEMHYVTHLLPAQEAIQRLTRYERAVAHMAWQLWVQTAQIDEAKTKDSEDKADEGRTEEPNRAPVPVTKQGPRTEPQDPSDAAEGAPSA